jgi:hypothetical protein
MGPREKKTEQVATSVTLDLPAPKGNGIPVLDVLEFPQETEEGAMRTRTDSIGQKGRPHHGPEASTTALTGVAPAEPPDPAPCVEVVDGSETLLPIPADVLRRNHVSVIRVKGDCMARDGVLDGDWVIVEKSDTASEGDLVVALTENNRTTLRRVHHEKNRIRLDSENPSQGPLVLDETDVAIHGIVVGILRKYPD